ncbi:hypothetical protein GCM10023115_18360 [Pontixanthobacter gangjinensis]|uniref:Uncharacterized protein n=1 Tax=Pontixanthobacter gangjinensis TaxID=1028742 RepID=A0A6I4SN04_9SPHN|nr:hypothetical protein [Pontixanthobacter gangjinensis]MXO57084.1 hypothetical protein [Pontixanthobacter gangjinensis]
MNDSPNDIIDDAKAELSGMAKEGMHHPSTKPVLTGAAVGAVAAAILPLVTWPIGLAIGAGTVFYKRIRK